jgi:hypothetical protein
LGLIGWLVGWFVGWFVGFRDVARPTLASVVTGIACVCRKSSQAELEQLKGTVSSTLANMLKEKAGATLCPCFSCVFLLCFFVGEIAGAMLLLFFLLGFLFVLSAEKAGAMLLLLALWVFVSFAGPLLHAVIFATFSFVVSSYVAGQ